MNKKQVLNLLVDRHTMNPVQKKIKVCKQMKFFKNLMRMIFGSKEEPFNLSSYLMGGHISQTTGKRYRKK
jgi:hypothetical protein